MKNLNARLKKTYPLFIKTENTKLFNWQ